MHQANRTGSGHHDHIPDTHLALPLPIHHTRQWFGKRRLGIGKRVRDSHEDAPTCRMRRHNHVLGKPAVVPVAKSLTTLAVVFHPDHAEATGAARDPRRKDHPLADRQTNRCLRTFAERDDVRRNLVSKYARRIDATRLASTEDP